MEAIEFVQLSEEDVPRMRGMLRLFGEVFAEPHTYCDRQPAEDYLRDLLGSRQFVALAALQGEAVVGGLAAYELLKFEQERSEFYIYDLAVAESCRRRGIATGLIRTLCGIAQARNAWVVMVQADWGDEAPIALYRKLGTMENIHHFDIRPGDLAP